MNHNSYSLSEIDKNFITYLRSLSIIVIVFGHVGGFWFFRPYSEFLHVFVPLFFFLSGAVAYYSFNNYANLKRYYLRRLSSILIPYYVLCMLSILVYIAINGSIPAFDFENLMRWIQIRPSNNIMPFPVGQVWFLHTLIVIVLISPLYFFLHKRNKLLLVTLFILAVFVSGLQLFVDVGSCLYFMGNNLYKPLIFSLFYISGMIWLSSEIFRNVKFLIVLFIGSLIMCIFLVAYLRLNTDFAFHTFSPDLYFVSGSFSALSLCLIFRQKITLTIKKNSYIEKIFVFFHEHTFSIFLLHTFSIYLVETLIGIDGSQGKTIIYGMSKFLAVLFITCIMAIPFTKLSVGITSIFLKKLSCF